MGVQIADDWVALDEEGQVVEQLPSRHALDFVPLSELRARVAARGPRRWLLRRIWPAGDYGVHSMEMKGQKTWQAVDLAVSVASGTPWLGAIEVDAPGPAIICIGEGSDANICRRIDAVAESRQLNPDQLPIVVCTRVPHLDDAAHLDILAGQLARHRPSLLVLDPLYLAARGAKGSDLYAMGEVLERLQHLCQEHGAALFVVTHNNRKEGRGPARISGAGPAEWGRVLIGGTVVSRRRDDDGHDSTHVVAELDVIGGEVADRRMRVHRTVWADDPDDLDSPLHYRVTVSDCEAETPTITTMPDAKPSVQRVFAILRAAGTDLLTVRRIGDKLADEGRPLKVRTIQAALHDLGPRVEGVEIDSRGTTEWRAVPEVGS